MNKTTKQILYWSPRVLGILLALFIGIFALDVFSEVNNVWSTLVALSMHLIPTVIVVLFLLVSWRREWIGGILFLCLAIFYVVLSWEQFPVSVYFVISGPLVLMSVLLFANWKYRTELRTR